MAYINSILRGKVRIFLKKGFILIALLWAWPGVTIYASEPAINGYSPVSYFTKGIAERGNPIYPHTYKGITYYFTSDTQIELFKTEPEKYIPHFGAFCPYSLALGKKQPIDPTNFKVVGEYLLLFHQTEEKNTLDLWNLEEDEQAMIEKAEKQYTLIRF